MKGVKMYTKRERQEFSEFLKMPSVAVSKRVEKYSESVEDAEGFVKFSRELYSEMYAKYGAFVSCDVKELVTRCFAVVPQDIAMDIAGLRFISSAVGDFSYMCYDRSIACRNAKDEEGMKAYAIVSAKATELAYDLRSLLSDVRELYARVKRLYVLKAGLNLRSGLGE